jgi:hypothetical protein
MSRHVAFRRQPVDQQFEQQLRTLVIPAPTRGLIQNENDGYMQPGGSIVQDNWASTLRGCKLRGGTIKWCDLHALDQPAWAINTAYVAGNIRYDAANCSFWTCAVNHTSAGPAWAISTAYAIGALIRDTADNTLWKCLVAHTSPGSGTFAAARTANPTYWVAGTFTDDRAAHAGPAPPAYWTATPAATQPRLPVISAFEYQSGSTVRMFAGQATKLFDVTTATPVLIKSGQTSGNYAAAQFANAAVSALGTNWMIVVNDNGDAPLRYNGSTWLTLDPTTVAAWANNTVYAINAQVVDTTDNTFWKCLVAHTSPVSGTFAAARTANPTFWGTGYAGDGTSWITGPPGTNVVNGRNLTYVWKYRNRLMFIEASSMNVWYLGINAVGGTLAQIPLAGSTTLGGKLVWGATWSMDAGDGLDEKCVFGTDQGEVIIFTGTNPADAANWRQQGRYYISPPMGMNAHIQVGGDLMVVTVDGIVPMSQAIVKSAGELELAMLTRTIKPTWRDEVDAKRAWSWSVEKWDEYGSIFVAVPGDPPGLRHCLLANNTTGAWSRNLGWDATCFIRMRADMFFGTQDGLIMQAERTGYDQLFDAATQAVISQQPYVATLVGGWEMFGAPANTIIWHQSRAAFRTSAREPFQPQLSATTDYVVTLPPPPPPGPDPGLLDVWDQGLWGPAGSDAAPPSPADIAAYAQWDQPGMTVPPVRNTLWISIGMTGFAHAPIVQVTVGQQAVPSVELLAISATYEPAGVNV